jgi:hypothetical protein
MRVSFLLCPALTAHVGYGDAGHCCPVKSWADRDRRVSVVFWNSMLPDCSLLPCGPSHGPLVLQRSARAHSDRRMPCTLLLLACFLLAPPFGLHARGRKPPRVPFSCMLPPPAGHTALHSVASVVLLPSSVFLVRLMHAASHRPSIRCHLSVLVIMVVIMVVHTALDPPPRSPPPHCASLVALTTVYITNGQGGRPVFTALTTV